MTVIQIPDDQAAALTERAAAQGLSLEEWFKKLAEEAPLPKQLGCGPAAAARIREVRNVPSPIPMV